MIQFCRLGHGAGKLDLQPRKSCNKKWYQSSNWKLRMYRTTHRESGIQQAKVHKKCRSLARGDSTRSFKLVDRGCSVPTVTGASVTGTGCTEGGSADHGTTCTWAADDTHTCSNVGATTCSAGSFIQTPSCVARHEEGLSTSGALTSEQCSRSRLF